MLYLIFYLFLDFIYPFHIFNDRAKFCKVKETEWLLSPTIPIQVQIENYQNQIENKNFEHLK